MTADTQAQGDKHEPVRKALEMLHNTLAVATKPKHHDEATARFRARLTPYDIAHLLNEHDRLAAALQGRAQEGEPSDERAAFEAWAVRERGGNVTRREDNSDRYASATVQGWWQSWKARAALAQAQAGERTC